MSDFILARREHEPAYVEYFRQEVPFRPDYPAFRLEVVTHRRTRRGQVYPLRERMIFDEREISAEKRAEGYRFYPEVLIDERPDLKHIHAGFADLGTNDGQLVRLMVYLVRGEDPEREGDHWVLAIRFSTIDIEAPSSAESEEDPSSDGETITEADIETAKSVTVRAMQSVVADPPSDAGSGWSIIGYSAAQLEYMEWLDAYRDCIKLVLMTSPVNPRMRADWQAEPHLFPEIAAHEGLEVGSTPEHPYWGGPGAYPVRLHAAQEARDVWNDELTEDQRRAAHARHQDIIRRLDRLYAYARDRMME